MWLAGRLASIRRAPSQWDGSWPVSLQQRDPLYATVYISKYVNTLSRDAGIKRHDIWPGNFLIAPRKILVIVNSRLIILKRLEAPGAFRGRNEGWTKTNPDTGGRGERGEKTAMVTASPVYLCLSSVNPFVVGNRTISPRVIASPAPLLLALIHHPF